MSDSGPGGHPGHLPLVSVVIPAYNAEKTLRLCAESAFAQSYPRLEVIVVDDASTDRCAGIGRELGCTVIEQPRNCGVSAARNTGAASSRGTVLFFLDSDVALDRDAVANAVRLLADDPRCGCVYGVYAAEPLIDDGWVEAYRTLHLHWVLARSVGLTHTAVFALAAVPKQVFAEVGPFDENLRSGEDDDYSERLLGRYDIRLSDSITGWHDEADRLLPLLAEQYSRAQALPFSARNRMREKSLKVTRVPSLITVALTLASLPLGLVWAPLLAVPAASLVLFALTDPPLARLAVRKKGVRFLLFFTAVHFLVHAALLAGAATGLARALADPSFGPVNRSARRIGARPEKDW